jgi:intein-encoded DNA endonuclease-like protein
VAGKAKISQDLISKFFELYHLKGLSLEQIKAETGVQAATIRYHLKKQGKPLRTRSEALKGKSYRKGYLKVPNGLTKTQYAQLLSDLYFKEKLSTYKIAKKLQMPPATVYAHLKRLVGNLRSISEARKGQRKIKIDCSLLRKLYETEKMSITNIAKRLNTTYYIIWYSLKTCGVKPRTRKEGSILANKIKPILNVSEDLSYILGVLLGDGSAYYNNGHGRIILTAKDREFIIAFEKALKNIGLNPKLYITERNGKHYYKIEAYSTIFVDWYKKLTYEKIKEMLSEKEFVVSFLRGFIDSEGSVFYNKRGNNKYLNVRIHNTNLNLLKFVQNLILELGFHCAILKEKRRITENRLHHHTSYHIFIKGGNLEANRFIATIKPNIPRKTIQNATIYTARQKT